MPSEPTKDDVAATGHLLKVLNAAEDSIEDALGWMPYPSEIEHDEARANLNRSLQNISDGLELVRRAKDEVEQAILTEAQSV